jgi:predicted small lipoprotein YifL
MRRAGILMPIVTRTGIWTVVALTAATLALGGCGRKGGLDLPPTASAAPTDSSGAPVGAVVADPSFGTDGAPTAAQRGSERGKRSFLLDPLLGN